MEVYKGITFASGYNKPFADFKKEFGSTHVFKNIPSSQRDSALEEAYKIAINGSNKNSLKEQTYGNVYRAAPKSTKDKRTATNKGHF